MESGSTGVAQVLGLSGVQAGVVLHAPLAHKGLVAVLTLELFGGVVQRAVHPQAVFVSEGFSTHFTGVRTDAGVAQHVQPQGVKLWQCFTANITDKISPGVSHRPLVLSVQSTRLRAGVEGGAGSALAALLFVPCQVSAQRGSVLELLTAQAAFVAARLLVLERVHDERVSPGEGHPALRAGVFSVTLLLSLSGVRLSRDGLSLGRLHRTFRRPPSLPRTNHNLNTTHI